MGPIGPASDCESSAAGIDFRVIRVSSSVAPPTEPFEHERATLRIYYTLLDQVRDKSAWLEEYTREQIQLEEQHIAEVEKMMRKPGELTPAG